MQDIIDSYNTKLLDLMIENDGVTVNRGFYEYQWYKLNHDTWTVRVAIKTLARTVEITREEILDNLADPESLITNSLDSLFNDIKSKLNSKVMLVVREPFRLEEYKDISTRSLYFNVFCRVAIVPRNMSDCDTCIIEPFEYIKEEGKRAKK